MQPHFRPFFAIPCLLEGRLNLVGNNFTIQSSFQVPAGASFELLRDGAPIALPRLRNIARADEIVGFDPAAVAISPSLLASDRPELAGGRFFVTADNQSLYLKYAIPEPGSLTLFGALAVVCASGCRRRAA
jgi:hypothetical protein